jgi:hypothetical protein
MEGFLYLERWSIARSIFPFLSQLDSAHSRRAELVADTNEALLWRMFDCWWLHLVDLQKKTNNIR